jgi:hypothetical protein
MLDYALLVLKFVGILSFYAIVSDIIDGQGEACFFEPDIFPGEKRFHLETIMLGSSALVCEEVFD